MASPQAEQPRAKESKVDPFWENVLNYEDKQLSAEDRKLIDAQKAREDGFDWSKENDETSGLYKNVIRARGLEGESTGVSKKESKKQSSIDRARLIQDKKPTSKAIPPKLVTSESKIKNKQKLGIKGAQSKFVEALGSLKKKKKAPKQPEGEYEALLAHQKKRGDPSYDSPDAASSSPQNGQSQPPQATTKDTTLDDALRQD